MQIKHNLGFWVGLAAVIAVAAALRMLSYQFSLPYIDHPDEPNIYLRALAWRGLFEADPNAYAYPPAYIALVALVQIIVEPLGIQSLAQITEIMRFIAVVANLATLIFIVLTARLAAGDVAGLVAGAAYAISPLVVENSVYALADPIVYLLVSLALWMAVVALVQPQRQHWCVWSMATGLIAILTKYPILPAVIPAVLAALVILLRDRHRGIRYLAAQVGMGLAGIVGLFFIFPLNLSHISSNNPQLGTISNRLLSLFDLNLLFNNLYSAVAPLQPTAFWIIGGFGVLAFLIALRRSFARVNIQIIALCLILLVSICWVAGIFNMAVGLSIPSIDGRLRDVLPATTAACVILGCALAQISYVFPRRWVILGKVVVILLLAIFVFIPHLSQSWALVQERRLPDRRVELRQWVDVNLEPGTVVVNDDNHKTFNPIWGGIEARHWVDWWMSDNIMEYPVEEWHDERGMWYAAIPLAQWQTMRASSEGREYLTKMLHLRDFIDPPAKRGPEVVFYRFWRMEHEVEVQFGDFIHLTGYDQSTREVSPGQSVTFRFYWQSSGRPPEDYSLFMHLTSLDAFEVLSQTDGAPAVPERPTLTWETPNETLISPQFTLTIPQDLVDGEYRILVGLYNYLNGQRLPIQDIQTDESSGDAYELARIRVSS